ncbi:DUF2778 domain-containing protein [Methylosinus sp. H3A]|uniref:DUF2778 domain-containing protein n=1 Tax=Methylosinus sp. H3A TaxID=2785786 RepID=UPI001FF0450D|nr:DUF2778 domain-containing protein [Methylosinus sp. H3A]
MLNSLLRREISRRILTTTLFLAGALTVGGLAGLAMRNAERAAEAPSPPVAAIEIDSPAETTASTASPSFAIPFGVLVGDLRAHAAPKAVVASLETPQPAPVVAPPPPARKDVGLEPATAARQIAEEEDESAPLPPPRPSEFGLRVHAPIVPATRGARKTASAPAPEEDSRSFFEKVFGPLQPTGKALAYAAPETGLFDGLRSVTRNPTSAYDNQTAVYDISAHTVYLPDGTRLEAHSGLGDKFDDPRFVHVRMHGATPPHTYDLTFRESLFHGVRAIRLTPVGGEGAIFGRAGLLAHTYMLGPRGDSNGCISFRNYAAFLRAFERGEVKRLVVVSKL